jgi:O-antigen/teichoic acid export membrane protein
MKKNKIINTIKDPLYKNSLFLMISTGVMSVFGFVFWIICARLYTAEQVGLATTIISVMSLITTFSLLGLGAGLVRYLPHSDRKNEKINTCLTLVSLVTIIVSTLFLLGIEIFSPRLFFIKENLILSGLFIIFMIFASCNSLLESIFASYRSAKYTLLKNTIFSVLKVVFPFLLVSLGVYGIFGSWMIGIIAGVVVSILVLVKKFGYKLKLVFHDSIIKKIGKYSFLSYVSGFIGSLPTLLLPLMITNSVHPEMTAYYYMAMMVANILFIIPQATATSLFAEGSNNEKELKNHMKKAVKIIGFLIIPAILITIFFGKYILLMLGKDYASEGYVLLNYLTISCLFMSINSIIGSLLQVKRRMKELVTINVVSAVFTLGLSVLWMSKGLQGIGLAWLVSKVIVCLTAVLLYKFNKKKN